MVKISKEELDTLNAIRVELNELERKRLAMFAPNLTTGEFLSAPDKFARLAAATLASCQSRLNRLPRRRKVYEHARWEFQGQLMNVNQLAKHPANVHKLTNNAIKARLEAGMNSADALSQSPTRGIFANGEREKGDDIG